MLGASLYIIVCSARNRLRVRLRRLREPRYLVGAAAALAYFYFAVFARTRNARFAASRTRRRPAPELLPLLQAGGATLVSLALLAGAAVIWLAPFDSGLLQFSQAEVQFLFPAPVTRRGLLVHRLLRSQLTLLFASLVTVFFYPTGTVATRLAKAVAVWSLLVSARLYFTAVTLARSRFAAKTAALSRVAWLPAGVMVAAVLVVAGSLWHAFTALPVVDARDALLRLASATTAGPVRGVLWPFMALVRPLFVTAPDEVFALLPPSLAVLAALGVWVIRSDAQFEETAIELAARQGGSQDAVVVNAWASRWRLAPHGRPEMAFAWKGVLQTLRVVDRQAMLRVGAALSALALSVLIAGRARGSAATFGLLAIVSVAFTILLAPQMLRTDLRQDLLHLDVLKTWPVRAGAVIRGEMMWPGTILTAVAWGAIAVAWYLSSAIFPHMGAGSRAVYAATAAIVAAPLIFAQFTVLNAAALLFPAWVPLGSTRPRGLDQMGQRLILLAATMLSVGAVALPGTLAGGAIWLAFGRLVGVGMLVPAALVCAAVMVLEVLALTEMLGPVYDRVDVSDVERGE